MMAYNNINFSVSSKNIKMSAENVRTINGKDGQDGKSAYEIAVEDGYTGTQEEWLASLKGETGPAGKDGEQGPAGAEGATPTLVVGTVTTLDAGSDATVEMTSDGSAYTVNFGIPKGDKGEGAEAVNVDWTQEDETQADYIKNKPYINKGEGGWSIQEGNQAKAIGNNSHAEGGNTEASGMAAHAEGSDTKAIGMCSHAEGYGTEANGYFSHAEGYNAKAKANYCSHAEGNETIASGNFQHVQGQYNIEDTGNQYAHIVGNGSINNDTQVVTRSNAHTIDWSGNGWFKGTIKIGGTGYNDANAKEVALKTDLSNYKTATEIQTMIDDKFNSIINGDEVSY